MFDNLPQTEAVNPRTLGLDQLASADLVRILIDEQRGAVDAALAQADAVAAAIDVISSRLRSGGRLHYVGAGTSGRLSFLDASEMPPTFGTSPELVCAHIAGGTGALIRAVEGAEDDAQAGASEMRDHVRESDAVVGISASGTAAFVIAALQTARSIGAWTIALANSSGSPLAQAADSAIIVLTGAEPLTGSTRLKAGTAQKVVLNTISTGIMIRLGKTFDNLMVDMVPTNRKLQRRAMRLVMQLALLNEVHAKALLEQAGSVKIAVVMARRGLDAAAARERLEQYGGSLRASL
ncbi:MAG: N-acetylmuramic acid 6-phosphate etherase [Candidatus Eremiobacteraeota bacterium]|nr:N-acetylmuramic acid 6-phosphate etherase [Candidatus Eremiobacteraeota bacterium]